MKPIPPHLLELKSCINSSPSDPLTGSHGSSKDQTVAAILIIFPPATGAFRLIELFTLIWYFKGHSFEKISQDRIMKFCEYLFLYWMWEMENCLLLAIYLVSPHVLKSSKCMLQSGSYQGSQPQIMSMSYKRKTTSLILTNGRPCVALSCFSCWTPVDTLNIGKVFLQCVSERVAVNRL